MGGGGPFSSERQGVQEIGPWPDGDTGRWKHARSDRYGGKTAQETVSAYVARANHAKRAACTDNWKETGQCTGVGEDVRGRNGITILGERRFTQCAI